MFTLCMAAANAWTGNMDRNSKTIHSSKYASLSDEDEEFPP
eukprot:CAMPEP_0113449742 /NCGR_PEP_ID=MMETSP0014_2-20120614/5461_1 /TAXON_ID=2857 /ORGANISM="Nitzschia sp." /LENGTH=40 /DNA_ID=CAMNT_0000341039 /DNA_START=187 /DNA_END=305 /DNA_ORIENTATION=+ /assembly_acc=CAM_ASM_000159